MYQNIFYEKKTKLFHVWDDEKGYYKEKHKPYAYIKHPYGKYTSIYNDKLQRIEGKKLSELKFKKSPNLFESDVKPEVRFLIDKYSDNSEKSEQNICFYDIEVDWKSKKDFKEATALAEDEITSITFWTSKTQKYFVLIWDPDNQLNNISNLDEDVFIKTFKTEKELLEASVNFISKSNITILSGWNSWNFDDIYYTQRIINILGKNYLKNLSPIKLHEYREYKQINKHAFAGFSTIDYLEVYKNFTYSEKPSYALDNIGEDEIGMKKLEYDGSLMDLFWKDRLTYLKYNVQDVRIMVGLESKKSYLDILISVAHIGHIKYEDALSSLRVIDGAVLTYLKTLGLVAPDVKEQQSLNLSQDFQKGDKQITFTQKINVKQTSTSGVLRFWKSKTSNFSVEFESVNNRTIVLKTPLPEKVLKHYKVKIGLPGAFVKSPQKGRYEWVYDLDFASLYPSIIRTLNMSVETKLGKVEQWNDKTNNENVEFFDKTITKKELKQFFLKNEYCISSDGVVFDMKKTGIIPTIISKWLDIRKDYKGLKKKFSTEGNDELTAKYDKLQHAYKILANSFYGVIANEFFRFYDIDIVRSITLTGQAAIKYTETSVNNYFNKELGSNKKDFVIAIDTDSIISTTKPLMKKIFPDVWEKDPLKYSKIICKTIEDTANKDMDVFAKDDLCMKIHKYPHYFKLKQEWICDAGLFVAKKRYGLHKVDEDGIAKDEMEVKGLDIVRSSYPVLFQNFLTDVLNQILKGNNKKDIDKFVITFKNNLEKEKDINAISTPTGVKGIKKYSINNSVGYGKGTPVHVKSSINYNKWLEKNNLNSIYNKIEDNSKIKWTYIDEKKTGYSTIAFPNGNLPKELERMIKENINFNEIFDGSINKKVMMFYNAMKWDEIVDIKNTFDGFFNI